MIDAHWARQLQQPRAQSAPLSFPGCLRMFQDAPWPSRNARVLMFNPEQEINLFARPSGRGLSGCSVFISECCRRGGAWLPWLTMTEEPLMGLQDILRPGPQTEPTNDRPLQPPTPYGADCPPSPPDRKPQTGPQCRATGAWPPLLCPMHACGRQSC
ncbi:hypothetical protein SKAU_G00144630 [Synaphobranchus kaupii]|uniref:Uncharacterized protein n=1 Tax=Synaphobranchus kaupii TaxID=118154 RepID=A0A9Q1FT15_SYNKA|nr:hypothetical protein SKAU_G00144630 [Synaphobranchus kaupii]